MRVSARTRLCAVIGDPVEHSLSPQIHNAAFRAAGVDLVYTAFHVRTGDLPRALDGVRALGIRGLSVTIPHKMDILPLLDEIEPSAAHVGSVNTVVNDDGRLKGFSSDGTGAVRAFQSLGVDPSGRNVLLLGSGGAARAIAFALAGLRPKPRLTILGIVDSEVGRLASDLSTKGGMRVRSDRPTPSVLARGVREAEIIVHATPVGMAPNVSESLVPEGLLRSDQVVFDAVYTPLRTRLLEIAERAGARTIPGLGMFVHQAAVQFELWTGRPAPVEVMNDVVVRSLAGEDH